MSAVRWALSRLVPARTRNWWRGYRRAGFQATALYVMLRARRWLGRGDGDRRSFPPVTGGVLFVCHGNIIRSPMAAALFAKHLHALGGPPLSVVSAGLRASASREADARARMVAPELGISLDAHRAALLTRQDLDQADIVFVMDHLNEAVLLSQYPDLRGKVYLLGALRSGRRSAEIVDPYHGDLHDVRQCCEEIDRVTGVLARSLVHPRMTHGAEAR